MKGIYPLYSHFFIFLFLLMTHQLGKSWAGAIPLYADMVFNGQHVGLPSQKYEFKSRYSLHIRHTQQLFRIIFAVKKYSWCLVFIAGWSSWSARLPHKQKVVGSSPTPATINLINMGESYSGNYGRL